MLKAMTDQEAETLVTAFTALCKDLVKDDAIMDERLLRASKERLYEAFDHHIARFESVRTTNPDLFYREDFDWAVGRFKTARFEIATFQTIDPEDESFVAQIWSDELEDESDEDTQKKILQIKLKYTKRGLAALEEGTDSEPTKSKLRIAVAYVGWAVWIVSGIWGFLLSLAVVNQAAGFWGVVIGFLFFPITFAAAPWYAVVAWGNWFPLIISYGGFGVGNLLMVLGKIEDD